MALDEYFTSRLRLPLIAAPMFLVSGPELVISACLSGVIGGFPTANARTTDALDDWLTTIRGALAAAEAQGRIVAPWAPNVVTHSTNSRLAAEMDVLERHRAPLVITALGGPRAIAGRVHGWGGKVLADVNSVHFARKAVAAGADGLILVASGAGGHTGTMNGFSFVAAVRDFFDGPVALGGGISTGAAIRAVEIAGADLAVMGTSFIATTESMAQDEYKQMLIDSTVDDLVCTNIVTSVLGNWLRPSLVRAGIDPDQFLTNPKVDFGDEKSRAEKLKRWRDIWSAGHGIGNVAAVEPVAALIDRLHAQYRAASSKPARFAELRAGSFNNSREFSK